MTGGARAIDEVDRLATLRSLNVLDTEPEVEYDTLVRLASTFCETPISLLSFVDRDRQFFKSRLGFERTETPREGSFCNCSILEPQSALVVPDASRDERFRRSPLVTGDPHIRFYAGVPLVMSDGNAVGTLCTIDVVPRELAPHQLEALGLAARGAVTLLEKRKAGARLRLLELVAVHASDGVAIVGVDHASPGGRRIEYVNEAFSLVTGFGEAEVRAGELGRRLLRLSRDARLTVTESGRRSGTVVDNVTVLRKDGRPADVEIALSPVMAPDGSHVTHIVAILRDVTDRRRVVHQRARVASATLANAELQREILERRRVEEQLNHAASHDALTALPNRTFFAHRLQATIERHRNERTAPHEAVVFVDLDRFKKVNDSLGHLIGDALLVSVAARLCAAVREVDVVARFAGDEFTLLVQDVSDEREARVIVERLASTFGAPFRLGSSDVFVTASIGATLVRATHATAEDALRDAEIAMFAAKQNGRARAQLFTEELSERFSAVAHLEASLQGALERKEFCLAYQPIVSLREPGLPLQGFEALVRWNSARGELGPAHFIPAAEETGLIVPLGEWILNEACERLAAWHAAYAGLLPLPTMGVNVSAKQFVSPHFVQHVERAISRAGIPPAYVALELTETTLMEDVENGRAVLVALRERGVRIHLDDFGTGYCSFGYLRRFAVDRLKVDRSFVSGGESRGEAEALAEPEIVRAIVTLAQSLGIGTIAEGVETEAQHAALVEMGCDAAQGFLYGSPLEDADGVLSSARAAYAAASQTAAPALRRTPARRASRVRRA